MSVFRYIGVVAVLLFAMPVRAEDGHRHEDSHAHEKDEHSKELDRDDQGEKHLDEKNKDHGDEEDKHNHREKEDHAREDSADGHDHHDEEHDDHGDEGFGENKAIVEVMDEGNKFRLHTESIKFLNLEFASVTHLKDDEYAVPSSAIVRFQSHTGVYRIIGEDVFEMLHLDVLKEEKGRAVVKAKNLKPKDRVVISKLGNLRAAQLQASGQGGEGHAH